MARDRLLWQDSLGLLFAAAEVQQLVWGLGFWLVYELLSQSALGRVCVFSLPMLPCYLP